MMSAACASEAEAPQSDPSLEADPDALIASGDKDFAAVLTTAKFGSVLRDAAAWKRIVFIDSGKPVFSSVAISGDKITATIINTENPSAPFQTNFTLSTADSGNEVTLTLSSDLKSGSTTAIKSGNLTVKAVRSAGKVRIGLNASPTFAANLFGKAKLKEIVTDLHAALGAWLIAESKR